MEVELQFLFCGSGPLVVPTRLGDLELRRSRAISILDTYYDTRSLELRQRGCAVRIRQAENVVKPVVTVKGPSTKRTGAKRRAEHEVEVEQLPDEVDDLRETLRELGLLDELEELAGGVALPELVAIGALRNRRSEHRYEHGLHRLELTWDELEFPTGPPEVRLEVEAASPAAERLLEQAANELRALFGDSLVEPERGKTRELCERLYPDLLAA
jgi:uncharacterized protein YjbK